MEISIIPTQDCRKEDAYEATVNALKKLLRSYGISKIECSLSSQEPMADKSSGKFKHIINKSS